MKLDTHVHTTHSGYSTIRPLARVMRESYNSVEGVYRLAKSRGMDLVTITDHDVISGVASIADRPDVITGCEVTACFPEDGVRLHLGVLGLDEPQHREIQRLRHDVSELLPYLREQRLFTSINHVASRINGSISAAHIAAVLPWVDGLEVRNGSRLASQNRTAAALSAAHRKVGVAGSDSHTGRGIGRTWIEAPAATTRAEFMRRAQVGRRARRRRRRALLHDGVRHLPHGDRLLRGPDPPAGRGAGRLARARHARLRGGGHAARARAAGGGARALRSGGPVQPQPARRPRGPAGRLPRRRWPDARRHLHRQRLRQDQRRHDHVEGAVAPRARRRPSTHLHASRTSGSTPRSTWRWRRSACRSPSTARCRCTSPGCVSCDGGCGPTACA